MTNQISIAGGAEFDIASLTRVQNPAVLLLRGEPTTALIMGGTNNPDPNAAYIADVTQRYVDPLADLPYDPPPVGVHTPEQFFPVSVVRRSTTRLPRVCPTCRTRSTPTHSTRVTG